MSAILAILTWKMLAYTSIVLALTWRIVTLTKRVEGIKADLAAAQIEILSLRDMRSEGFDVQKRLQSALALSEMRYSDAIQAIHKFAPPEDAAGAMNWLNTKEAKG